MRTNWRKLYREGRLGGGTAEQFLPVKVADNQLAEAVKRRWSGSTIRDDGNKTSEKEAFVLLGLWMWWRYARSWSVWSDDRATGRNADLDRSRSDRSATWFHRAEWDGADGAGAESVFRSRVCFSWTAGRSDQAVMVGWRWSMSVREKIGARPLPLAASNQWNCGADTCPTIHVAGRDRLATSGAQLRSTDRRVSTQFGYYLLGTILIPPVKQLRYIFLQ